MTSLEVRIGSLFRFPTKQNPPQVRSKQLWASALHPGTKPVNQILGIWQQQKIIFLQFAPAGQHLAPAIPAGGVCHYRRPAGLFECAGKAQRRRHFDCAGTLRRASQSGRVSLAPRSKAAGAAAASPVLAEQIESRPFGHRLCSAVKRRIDFAVGHFVIFRTLIEQHGPTDSVPTSHQQRVSAG